MFCIMTLMNCIISTPLNTLSVDQELIANNEIANNEIANNEIANNEIGQYIMESIGPSTMTSTTRTDIY